MATRKCAAVVVGAGPAGVAVVGNLLERQLGAVAWIDPSFESGRVHRKYREVPSNTKVSLFQAYATSLQPFRTVIENTPRPNAFTAMAKLDQEKTCHLHYAADMIRALTDGLIKMEQVHACRGFVTAANLSSKSDKPNWTVHIKQDNETDLHLETTRLILCTGAHPTNLPIPVPGLSITPLNLDVVLKPSELATTLTTTPTTVAVIGASHSAILALLNLLTLAQTSHPHLRVKWFTRHPLRYAEYKDGWILRDNTGLKGSAADFARTQLEDSELPTSEAGKVIEKVDTAGGEKREKELYAEHLPGCQYIVQAVGFTRDPVPKLSQEGESLGMEFDHETGRMCKPQAGPPIPGLFGAGIAFPERVVDPYGNVEYAVGFFKFMNFLRRVVPGW
ncbi:hypothetical protein N7532_011082 [Penicillium argentinense]|uniref:FAD/NAD(P)-binding domain-containing protein n=1 Tax=Penicillium argentinense TaxID=1131581 RepID=A0A9W9EHR8_9EURO|nr:uncharacterized protein N7532_011082 [Penicillium argentinense]KAJ5082039.1 hypothetical protein N7532_011082 [Penicillium argentinense]